MKKVIIPILMIIGLLGLLRYTLMDPEPTRSAAPKTSKEVPDEAR